MTVARTALDSEALLRFWDAAGGNRIHRMAADLRTTEVAGHNMNRTEYRPRSFDRFFSGVLVDYNQRHICVDIDPTITGDTDHGMYQLRREAVTFGPDPNSWYVERLDTGSPAVLSREGLTMTRMDRAEEEFRDLVSGFGDLR